MASVKRGDPESPLTGASHSGKATAPTTRDTRPRPATTFDPEKLRLSQDFAALAGVKKLITTVPVRKPNNFEFIRAHPDSKMRLEGIALIELPGERTTYLLRPELYAECEAWAKRKVLLTVVNRQGVLLLWPAALPGPDGRSNPWNDSAEAKATHMSLESRISSTATGSNARLQVAS